MPQLLLVPPLQLLLEVVGRSSKAWWWWVVETAVGEGHSPVAARSGWRPWSRAAACVSVSPGVLVAVLVLVLLGCLAPQLGVLREQRLRGLLRRLQLQLGAGQFLRRLRLQLQ